MNAASLQVPKSLKDTAKPERCALVVYDMQAGILSQLSHGREILGKVLEVLELARALRLPHRFLAAHSISASAKSELLRD